MSKAIHFQVFVLGALAGGVGVAGAFVLAGILHITTK